MACKSGAYHNRIPSRLERNIFDVLHRKFTQGDDGMSPRSVLHSAFSARESRT